MSKYINADKLVEEIMFNEEDAGIIGSKEVIDIIQNMPAADVIEAAVITDAFIRSYCEQIAKAMFGDDEE